MTGRPRRELGDSGPSVEEGETVEFRTSAAPLRLTLIYLIGTALTFFVVGDVDEVENPGVLAAFLLATWLCVTAGYAIASKASAKTSGRQEFPKEILQTWVTLSGFYYIVYGIVYLAQFDLLDPVSLISAVLNPGESYQAKFSVFELQSAGGVRSPAAQLLTILSFLSLPLLPFLIVGWEKLSTISKAVGLSGIVSFALFYLGIGTIKGLADLVIFAGAGIMVRLAAKKREPAASRKASRLPMYASLVAVTGILLSYMAISQSQRVEIFGTQDTLNTNPTVEALVGEDLALGIASVVSYPTHGYVGLSKSLSIPFEWTAGRGASRAVDSYVVQYLGWESVETRTFPARAEVETGWPALLYWSTVYPWLASDLSFPGAALFMVLVGYVLKRSWDDAVIFKDPVALLMFGQVVLFIAYVPANNQIGSGRQSLIAFCCVLVLYAFTRSGVSSEG